MVGQRPAGRLRTGLALPGGKRDGLLNAPDHVRHLVTHQQHFLEWATFLQEHGREEEAEPILRRAYDLGVNAETVSTRKR